MIEEKTKKTVDDSTRVCMISYTVATSSPITDTLRRVIAKSGMTNKALARETEVHRPSIIRFMRSEQSLRLDMADKLAVYFGLELVPTKRKAK